MPLVGQPYTERMVLTVNGQEYWNWKTARVTKVVDSPFHEFQFTSAEPIDRWRDSDLFKIRPRTPCTIAVGGITVIGAGIVEVRETTIDENEHNVMFFGRDYCQHAYESSVRMQEGGQIMNGTFSAIVSRCLQGTGVGLRMLAPDDTVFRNFAVSFGETPWHVAERLKRYIPGLRVTSDGARTWIAHTTQTVEDSGGIAFVEGENILRARSLIDARTRIREEHVKGQNVNSNDSSPKGNNEVEGHAYDNTVEQERYRATYAEDPVDQKMAQGRAEQGIVTQVQDTVHCQVTVYSWFARAGELFDVKKIYTVHSPMLAIDKYQLWSRVVAYEQSDAGSLTTIDLCTIDALSLTFQGGPQFYAPGPDTNFGGQGSLLREIDMSREPR